MNCGRAKILAGGFTLVEMMVVCALIGILAMIALPDFANIIKNERLTAQNNDLISDISFARAEAMRTGARVTICPVANPAPSPLACSNDWSQGRMVFSDADRDMELDTSATSVERVLRIRGVIAGANTLSWDGALQRLQFRGSGLPGGGLSATNPVNTIFKLCDSNRPNVGRTITVSTYGTVNSSGQVVCP